MNHHQHHSLDVQCGPLVWLVVLFALIAGLYSQHSHAIEAVKPASQPKVQVFMRQHGYQMGDFIDQKIIIQLPKGIAIDEQSLPLVGYVKPWLDIKKVDFKQAEQQAVLTLQWQIFATVEMTQVLKTPAIILKTNAKSSAQIQVPAIAFYYSSVLPANVGEIQKRPNLSPLLFDSHTPTVLAFFFLSLAFLLIGLWCWMTDRLPWWPYRHSPMVRLAQAFKHKDNIQPEDAIRVYQALNACAGERLYVSNISILFDRAPYLLPYQQAIVQCLTQTNHYLYQHRSLLGQTTPIENGAFGSSEWIKQAAIAERLAWCASQAN